MEIFGHAINTNLWYWFRFFSWATVVFVIFFIVWKQVIPNLIYTTKERTREKLAEKQKKQQNKL